MLNTYTSSHQNTLLQQFAKDLKKSQKSVFQSVTLISAGFSQDLWIKEQVASINGLVANLKTFNPNRFMGWLDFVLNSNQAIERFTLPQLEWIYFSELGDDEFRGRFPELDVYFNSDQVKRFALAQKAVSLLDKYQDFRPELIQKWRDQNNLNTEDWQEYLFVKVLQNHADLVPDKSLWPYQLQKKLETAENKALLKSLIPILYIFGNFSLTPKFLETIKVLQGVIPVHWYRLEIDLDHPTAKNWNELQERNKLVLKETFQKDQIHQLNPQEEQSEPNLLSKAQTILASNKLVPITEEELKRDSSLEFHSCHTRIREVESLYNYLIRLLNTHKGIGTRDIHVFAPQIDDYIAPIRTVFDTAPLALPYRIISGGYSHEESFWSGLIQLLSMDAEHFTTTQILELIESKAIREYFGFEDLELIRKMMSEAHMAREFEGSKDTETRFYSFEYGLKRLIYGYLLGKDQFEYDDGEEEIFTLDSVEGKQADDLFRLFDFIKRLNQVLISKENPRELKSWLEWVASLANDFFKPDPQTEAKFQKLLQEFGLIDNIVTEAIDFKTFSFRLIHLLEDMDSHRIEGYGGITISQIMPGRVLPKKVIAMIGMNFREFPRTAKELSFDKLLQGEKGALDPNPRISDQGTFLEAVFAAKEALYFSYLGKNDQDNSSHPASTVVEEFMDLVATAAGVKPEELVIHHPLHSFSSEYNHSENEKLKNYLFQKEAALKFNEPSQEPTPTRKELDLVKFRAFLKDPFRYFYNHVLGVYYSDINHQLSNHERFESDALNDWLIKDILLHDQQENEDLASSRKKLIVAGLLPLRNRGLSKLEKNALDIQELKENFNKILPITSHPTELLIGEVLLRGKLNIGSDSNLIYATPSKVKKRRKYLIDAGLDYLFGVASGTGATLHLLGLDENTRWSQLMTQEEATQKLHQLVEIFLSHSEKKFVYSSEINLDRFSPNEIQDARKKVLQDCQSPFSFTSEYLKKEASTGFFEADQTMEELLQNYKTISDIFNPFLTA